MEMVGPSLTPRQGLKLAKGAENEEHIMCRHVSAHQIVIVY